MEQFENLSLEITEGVARLGINRPSKANSLDGKTWSAIGEAFRWLDQQSDVRVIVIHGEGKGFCAGIDFGLIMEIFSKSGEMEDGPKQEFLLQTIRDLQASFTAIENCRKPVIAAIHGSCYGGGIDLITACDIRLGTKDAKLCVKEIDLAIVADVGTLQRLPHIVGQGIARELAFTGRTFSGEDAQQMGLLNSTYDDHESLLQAAKEMAQTIASKSPMAVRGVKQVMNYCRDVSVRDGLEHVAIWNTGMLLTRDSQEAFVSMMEKRVPQYKD